MGDTFHRGKYYVSFKGNLDDCKKDITITIIKVFENDTLKISLSDDEDPCFLCVLKVTRSDYEDLKKHQGLLIDFDHFPAQLVRLLQQCAANNMFMILQQNNPLLYYFEIVEHNEFRRLVHLSLKTAPASDYDIKKHMADNIGYLKKSLSTLKHSSSNNEVMWNEKRNSLERKIHDLTVAVTKLEEEKIRKEAEHQEDLRREKDRISKEKIEWQKNNDIATKSQTAAMQEMASRKERQIEDLNAQCKQLHENINTLERQLRDKLQRVSMLESEVQSAHIDVANTKARNATLEKTIMEKDNLVHQLRMKCSDYEKTTKDDTECIQELKSTIQLLKKEKKSLEERMALSESLANRNNEAAHSTAEQLLKANQIISKQNTDLMEMKDKLLCRTAIALEQEKVIERNTKDIEELKCQLQSANADMEKVKTELENLKEKLESNENILKDKEEIIKNNNLVIQWMHKKMEDNCLSGNKHSQGERLGSSSTPFLDRHYNDSSHEHSEELPNFYASSRLSETEESPRTQVISKSGKAGLDPKYLQPATDDNRRSTSNKSKPVESDNARGKENKNVNLPNVNYRDKKSSRSNTYRATPVSAYFP